MISLIGYRGTGKSTIGKRLAKSLKWDWLDADHELEQRAGRTIQEIFTTDGEPTFRRLEREVLADLFQRDRLVLSTGGGCILNAATRRDLLMAGPVVWLIAPLETIALRVLHDSTTKQRRPSLTATGGIEEIRTVMAQREPLYRECATITINTDRMPLRDIVSRIVSELPVELIQETSP